MRRKISSPDPQQKKLQQTEEKIQEKDMLKEVVEEFSEEELRKRIYSEKEK